MKHTSTCAAHTVDEPVASRREIATLAVAATATATSSSAQGPNVAEPDLLDPTWPV